MSTSCPQYGRRGLPQWWRAAAALFLLTAPLTAAPAHTEFVSQNRKIVMDIFPAASGARAPAVILLYGSGGLDQSPFPYSRVALELVEAGYSVYLPHYLTITKDRPAASEKHYRQWATVVQDAIRYVGAQGISPARTALVGYSLGASVALTVGAADPQLGAVVEISGSFPDELVPSTTKFPPLLIVHGAGDRTIPVSNALQLAELCQLRGFQCQTKYLANEDHRFTEEGVTAILSSILTFLAPIGKR